MMSQYRIVHHVISSHLKCCVAHEQQIVFAYISVDYRYKTTDELQTLSQETAQEHDDADANAEVVGMHHHHHHDERGISMQQLYVEGKSED